MHYPTAASWCICTMRQAKRQPTLPSPRAQRFCGLWGQLLQARTKKGYRKGETKQLHDTQNNAQPPTQVQAEQWTQEHGSRRAIFGPHLLSVYFFFHAPVSSVLILLPRILLATNGFCAMTPQTPSAAHKPHKPQIHVHSGHMLFVLQDTEKRWRIPKSKVCIVQYCRCQSCPFRPLVIAFNTRKRLVGSSSSFVRVVTAVTGLDNTTGYPLRCVHSSAIWYASQYRDNLAGCLPL